MTSPASHPPARYRLAVVTSHPVQYQAPLFQRLAAHPDVDLSVFYGHDMSIVGGMDVDFGVPIAWDRPLLEGYRYVLLRGFDDGSGPLGRLLADARIMGHLWRGRFDAVFIHSYATRLSLFAYCGALIRGTPVMLRTESEEIRHRSWWVRVLKQAVLRPLFAVTAAVLVIGHANRRFFDHHGVDAARQFRTPYSVDNEYLTSARRALQPRRQALRQAFGFPDDVVVVGYSGKLVPWKNVPELVDAVAALQHEGCRVGLLLVGEGRDRAALEQRVGARAMQWVTFTGFRNQSELPACYICFDVFVLPSRRESWGLVLNEAMAFGLPVIATHMAGGAYDLIEEGRNGYIYRSGDGAALTAALRSLVTSAEERARFGRRSEAIVEGYSYDICVSGILDALRYVAPKAEVPA